MKKLTLLLLFLTSINLFAFTQTNFDIALRDFENNNMAKYSAKIGLNRTLMSE